ncbi:MAG: DUF6036 family nucleotidyltransferase [Saccharofermentanales bacterium]
MDLDRIGMVSALNALNDQLVMADSPRVEIVVCGGSALQALSLVNRTTRDVDILAFLSKKEDGSLHLDSAKIFPDYLLNAVKIVARDFRLPADWFNCGPTDLLSQGLPDGLLNRLECHNYGSHLIVHFISRFDQTCFKMYAAINGGGERHLNDLYRLEPAENEVLTAAIWCLTQDASIIFPLIVKDFLRKVGFVNVAERLE